MTIEEAIEFEIYCAKSRELIAKRCDDANGYSRCYDEQIRTTEAKTCEKRAEEHRQIAEWLKELKRQREALEKVMAEIQEIKNCESKNHDSFDDYSEGRYDVVCQILNIIEKYLEEG